MNWAGTISLSEREHWGPKIARSPPFPTARATFSLGVKPANDERNNVADPWLPHCQRKKWIVVRAERPLFNQLFGEWETASRVGFSRGIAKHN
jgi:hypothetical protein